MNRQNDTTNGGTVAGLRVEMGWGVMAVTTSTPNFYENVTFSTPFTEKPIVLLSPGGDSATNGGYGTGSNILAGQWMGRADTINTGSFRAACNLISNAATPGYVWYQWIALGH